jgi:DNA-binding CsgD family transcriptional regulator/PAS domain-containing protein
LAEEDTVVPNQVKPTEKTSKSRKSRRLAESSAEQAMSGFAWVSMALVMIDLTDHRILAANAAAGEMLNEPPESLVGRLELDFISPSDHESTLQAHADVLEGRLDGYQAHRTFLPSQRPSFEAEAWVRLLDAPVPSTVVLLAIGSDDGSRYPVAASGAISDISRASLMAITDHDWIVARASADSEAILGIASRELIGTPLLGLIHPSDASNLLFAVSRATASGHAVVCRLRLRTADHSWRNSVSFVNLMCEHSPPRLGILAVDGADVEQSTQPPAEELQQHIQRIAVEIRAAELLIHAPDAFGETSAEEMAALTSRQWEILSRLNRGETAVKIAAALFLSPSTVRNHLLVLYRQFGVHSQLELLARFRAPLGKDLFDDQDRDGHGVIS